MSVTVAVLCALLSYVAYRSLQIGRRGSRLPNGPPTFPLLGNAHLIPTTGLAKKFRQWTSQYDPVFSLKVGNGNLIVLADRQSVNALLDKKGSIYSDRPPNYFSEFVTHGDHLVSECQSAIWREKRSIITRNLSPKLLDEKHFRIQEAEAVIFMKRLFEDPDNIVNLTRLYTASVATTLVWGHRPKDMESFWFKDLYYFLDRWLTQLEPGANPPIDQFPILKYLPGRWRKRFKETRHLMDTMWGTARKIVDERRARGDRRDSIIDDKLDEYESTGWPISQHAFNNTLGEMIEAGADTTANQLATLILAFAKYPQVQRKAQAEIDDVCGTERAPLFSDFERLPYINAIIKEGLRWRPTAPLGVPHLCTQDNEYLGKLIPKNSTIFLSIWSIHHNEDFYADHDRFDPDRFMNHRKLANEYATAGEYENRDKSHPVPVCGFPARETDWHPSHHFGYGAGRRLCPGIHLAERSMWRIAAKLLWAFEFHEPVDEYGQVISLDPDAYTPGLAMKPMPYKVRVTPRSPVYLACVEKELEEALRFVSQWN